MDCSGLTEMTHRTDNKNLQLLYTLFCDDVRLEAGNKLSFMGVFQNIMVQQLPISLIKFAVVNHWQGQGSYLSEVRILTPDRQQPVVVSQPTRFEIALRRFRRQHQFLCERDFPEAGTLRRADADRFESFSGAGC